MRCPIHVCISTLRICCMCGMNQSCAWVVCPCLLRKHRPVRALSSGSSLVQDWELSLQCCSFPWPAISGRRTNGIFSLLFFNFSHHYLITCFLIFPLIPLNILPFSLSHLLPHHCCKILASHVLFSFLNFVSSSPLLPNPISCHSVSVTSQYLCEDSSSSSSSCKFLQYWFCHLSLCKVGV